MIPTSQKPAVISVREETFLQQVRELAHLLGWLTYHTRDSRRSEPGFPDLALCHPQRGYLMAELKSAKGKLSPAQTAWITALSSAGVEVVVWRPADWQQIVERLGGQSRPCQIHPNQAYSEETRYN